MRSALKSPFGPRARRSPRSTSPACGFCAVEALEPRTLLAAADLTASLTYAPGTYYPGQSITGGPNVPLAVLNSINVGGAAADFYRTSIVLSTDTTLGNADDIAFADFYRDDAPLAPGTIDRTPRTLTIRPAFAAGRYYVIVQSDPTGRIPESVEANNIWISAAADVVIAKPTVSITATDKTAAEQGGGTNTGRFRISRTGPTDVALAVAYTPSGTTTASGPSADFTALSGSVTIPAGSAFATVIITPINDTAVEGTENVILTLSAADGYTVATGVSATARVDINDNDGSRVGIVATDPTAEEAGTTTATYTVSRTGAGTAGDLTVNYAVTGTAAGGTDFAVLTRSVVIPDGAASATITLIPVDDQDGELSETVILTISPSTSYLIVASRRSARATIADNEPIVKIAATDASATEAGATPGTATYTLTRTGSTTADLIVLYSVDRSTGAATPGVDYRALSGTVTIPAGSLTATILLTPIDDAVAEPPEPVVVNLEAGDGYRVDPATGRRRATAMIADNEPMISIQASDAVATESGTTTAAFTISRSGTPTGELVVLYSTIGGTATPVDDYTALTGSVTIPDGQTNITVLVTPVNDTLGEGSETVILTLLAPAGAAYSKVVARSTARATIADNEPSVSIIATDATATEADVPAPTDPPAIPAPNRTATFTITRTGSTSGSITIPYVVTGTATPSGGADPADYAALAGTATIADGQANITIVVSAIDDALAEPGETIILRITGNNGYLVAGSRSTATATIADNEPVVSIVATDATATEADAPTPTTPPANPAPNRTATFTISIAAAWTSDLTIPYTITGTALNTTDYGAIDTSVTIPAGSTTATVTITPVQDSAGEGDETVDLTLVAAPWYTLLTAGDRNKARATIRDDEPVVSIVATDATATEQDQTIATFTLTRTGTAAQRAAELTINYLVSGTAEQGDDYEVLDGSVTFAADSATATVVVYAIDDLVGESAETVILTLEGGGPAGGDTADAAAAIDPAKASATATITDNEAVVSIVATDAAAGENGNPGALTVRRTGDTSEPLVVLYVIGGTAIAGDDYTTLTGTVTIAAGSSAAVITITPVYDLLTEPAAGDTVVVTLVNPIDDAGYRLDTARAATVTIANAPAVDLYFLGTSPIGQSLSLASTGLNIPIVATVGNLGDAAAGSFSVEFRFSSDSIWGNDDDVVIGSSTITGLTALGGAGATSTIAFTFSFDSIKARLTAGNYHLNIRIDPAARLSEGGARRDNNTYTSPAADWVVTP